MENSQTHRAPLPPARSATKFIIGSARQPPQTFTAFRGERLLASGTKLEVALSVKAALQTNGAQTILIFEDGTGRQVDFDLRGEDHEIAAWSPMPSNAVRARRSRAGVVGSVTRADELRRRMIAESRFKLFPRGIEGFAPLAAKAGFKIAETDALS